MGVLAKVYLQINKKNIVIEPQPMFKSWEFKHILRLTVREI